MNLKVYNIEGINPQLKQIYIIVFTLLMYTRLVPYLGIMIKPEITSFFFAIIAAFGILLLILDLATEKACLKSKYVFWLFGFIAVMFISSALNANYGIMSNINCIVWTSILFFVLYTYDYNLSRKELKRQIKLIEHIFIIIYFCSSVISDIMFLMQTNYTIQKHNGDIVRQGFMYSRLFGVYVDPNYASIIAAVIVVLCLKYFLISSNIWFRIFYMINIIIQYIYIALSGSRTTELALSISILFGGYFIIRSKIKDKFNSNMKREALSILLSILSVVVFLFINSVVKNLLSYAPSVFSFEFSNIERIDMTRMDVKDNDDVSNLRFTIWESVFEIFKSKPIFGTSPRHMITYAKEYFPDGIVAVRGYLPHNLFFDVLACTGIVGAIIFFTFIIKCIFFIVKNLLILKGYEVKEILFYVIPALLIGVSSMFVPDLMFYNTQGAVIFWAYLGYIMYHINVYNAKEIKG